MKFLIFSDIHGCSDSAAFIVQRTNEENPDKVLLLGDILYHGPRNDIPENYNPKKVIEELRKIAPRILAVRGNCEAEVDQMVLSFPCLSQEALVYADGNTIFMTHGHIYNEDRRPECGYTHFFSGHTHLHVLKKKDGITFLNPGSISIPKNGEERSYAIYDDGRIEIRMMEDDSVILEM